MNHIETVDDWDFEITTIRARKTLGVPGNPYSAIGNITIVNGEPWVEGLLSTEPLTKSDHTSLTKYLTSKGFKYYYSKENNIVKRNLI